MCRESTEEGELSTPLVAKEEHHQLYGSGTSRVLLVVMMVVRVRVDLPQSQVGYSSPTQSGIVDDLGLTVAEYSLFGSILTIGAMIGAIVSGQIVDYIGGRGGACWLDLGRLLVGCGMGLLSYVVPIYIAEITPKNLRGGFTTVH
nr:sugar transporter erd6-like 5 [Quercus suber]